MRAFATERDVCILDVSTGGILATASVPPLRGEFVELMIGRHTVMGHVRWSGQHRFGLSLRQRVSIAALLAGDTDSVSLEKAGSVQTGRGGLLQALRANSHSFGHAVQFAVMAAAGLGGAYLLADIAGEGLESLGTAQEAMARR